MSTVAPVDGAPVSSRNDHRQEVDPKEARKSTAELKQAGPVNKQRREGGQGVDGKRRGEFSGSRISTRDGTAASVYIGGFLNRKGWQWKTQRLTRRNEKRKENGGIAWPSKARF